MLLFGLKIPLSVKIGRMSQVIDYRPISLTNIVYRLIAKSLANRLKEELPSYIHQSPHAFIQGRRIIDNIVIAQEIVRSFNLKAFKHKLSY